ncbi:MAG TPA: class I SAM-dependent methyltransferase [Lacipirellula sp.]
MLSALTEAVLAQDAAVEAYVPGRSYLGRLIAPPMHYSGAGWLTRKSRTREEHPKKMLKSLALKPGQVVCDFGCGNGYHTLQLARLVGPKGLVYAVDIQQEMLDMLAERSVTRGLENIKPVLATAEDPGLPPETFDLVLMVDVYHELSHPPEVLELVRSSLKPDGRLVLVEFREEDPEVPILPLHKMSQPQVLRELTANEFKLVGQYDKLPWQHVLMFAREDSKLPKIELREWTQESE